MTEPVNNERILLVTRNFPPLTGGMERLMLNIARGLADWSDLTLVGPKGCTQHCPKGVKVYETPTGLAPFLLVSLFQAMRACRQNRFHTIIGGSGVVAPLLALLKLVHAARTVVLIHGLDLVVNSVIYQTIFVPCIRRADLVISNSQGTTKIALEKHVPPTRITVINPGTELPDTSKLETGAVFCARHKIPFKKVMLFVGRMTKRKGLSQFIKHSLPYILEREPDAGLVIVGNDSRQSLTDFGEHKEILETVKGLQMERSIIFLGNINDDDLLACYAMADVHIFPLIEVLGDVEGFGMVAIEAAACGTPTVTFDTGGVSDAVAKTNGRLIPRGQYELFTTAVVHYLQAGNSNPEQCIEHAKRFTWDRYNLHLKNIIRENLYGVE